MLKDFAVGAEKIDSQKGTPFGVQFAGVLAYFFVLREIGQSLMLFTSVGVDLVKEVVTLQLPASKTDWVALSCERSWGCVCSPGAVTADACPFHAAVAQQSLLRERFGDRVEEPGFPFMPSQSGAVMNKEGVAKAVARAATAAGVKTTTEDGEETITGHYARISGSRMLARGSVPVESIMRMARWDSHVVLHYLKDSVLVNVTGQYRKRHHRESAQRGERAQERGQEVQRRAH